MGSDPVTVVANSVPHYDQSINLGIYDSDTALWPDWNKVVICHAGNTSVVVFVGERSLDLNPSVYYVWGYMKTAVYAHMVNMREELLQRILSAAVLHKVTSSLVTRVRKCI
jgi:hypothetical protein